MAGKRQKPPDELVYRRGGRVKPLVPVAPAQLAPRLPDGLGDHAVAVWAAFWASGVSGAVDLDADDEALRHWILSVDEREKLRAATVRAPLVKGSHEQLMLNPLFRRLRDLNREIERAEEHFGMTPLARLRLGVTFLQEQVAKADLEAKRKRRRPHRLADL
ncbi:MAG: P27 family phage terminase small subunit [Methanosarcina sp.]